MQKIFDKVLNSAFIQTIIKILDKVYINRANKISIWDLGAFFYAEVRKNSLTSMANAVAFNFTLAIFPSIIFLFTLVPYIPIFLPELTEIEFQNTIHEFLNQTLPQALVDTIWPTILDIISNKKGGLLTFGFIFAFFLSTNGMLALMSAFNKCYTTKETRGFFRKRLIAAGLTILLTMVLLTAVASVLFSDKVVDLLMEAGILETKYIFGFIEYFIIFLLFLTAISAIYYFAPTIKRRWKFFSFGSVCATILALVASITFSYYVDNFGAKSYNKLYGSIGMLIAFMLWMQILAFVLLIGFEINASIDAAKKSKEGELELEGNI